MRTSGRGRSETLMFIAPAAIFGGFLLLMSGTPLDALLALDRFLMKIVNWTVAVGSAAVHAILG